MPLGHRYLASMLSHEVAIDGDHFGGRMGVEIALRFIIFLEVASGAIAVLAFPENPSENWAGLVAAAVFIAFLYFVFHIPLRKKLQRQEQK